MVPCACSGQSGSSSGDQLPNRDVIIPDTRDGVEGQWRISEVADGSSGGGAGPQSTAAPAGPAPVQQQKPLSPWEERTRTKAIEEIFEAGERAGMAPEELQRGLQLLQTLFPTLVPNIDLMKPAHWASMLADVDSLSSKVLLLKRHFPSLDMYQVISKNPRMLLRSEEQLEVGSQQIHKMLFTAKDIDAVVAGLPDLLDPSMLYSIITSFTKLFPQRSPVEVLENEGPELLQRMMDHDVPLEPVFFEQDTWSLPSSKQVKAGSTIYQKYASDYNDGLNPLDDPSGHY